jgi:iron complex outermembrane recepter protein
MKSATTRAVLLGATALAVGATAMPAMAQDIIVTAQRTEERLQEVPISITVFTPEEIADKNIISAKDIATFTPGVYAQTRFGNDTTTYTIRGFAQEQRTTATVGTYFAEVVAPRGNGVSQGGDGASPGALFDLENVQVLKGPQGTLFGRNTTGGAVLLVPKKPTDEFEGYVEGTVGNLNRWRIQGVLNLPVSDTFRLRFGVDRHKRDGYIKNIGVSAKHDEDMGSIDIIALRGSAVWDITDNIENYTIVTYSESKSSGALPLIKTINTDAQNVYCVSPLQTPPCQGAFLGLAQEQVAREAASGMGWWVGTNSNPYGESYNEEFRVINRTTIDLSDSITLTNLFGYSEFKSINAVDAFGLNSQLATPAAGPQSFFSFVPILGNPDYGGFTANQRSIVEELRLNGTTGRLTWQGGFYYEKSSPKEFTGTLTPSAAVCFDIANFQCANSSGATYSANKVWNRTIAAYAQATYDLTEQFALTAGIRWTEDRTRALWANGRVRFSPATGWMANTYECGFQVPGLVPDAGMTFPNTFENRASRCFLESETKTSAPTWLINLEYKPNNDLMFYGKYSRGYRQGSIVPPSPPGLEAYPEEQVDAFEVGAKTSWPWGTFNVAAFYNKFKDQQIQAGISSRDGRTIQTTIIVPGKSELYGIEADLMVRPTDWFRLQAAYSYNHTKLISAAFPDLSDHPFYGDAAGPLALDVRELEFGGPLPLAVPHAFNATATFILPFDESVGEISLSGTIVHQSSFRAVADAPTDAEPLFGGTGRGILPKRTFGNINLNWKSIGGGPVDAALWVTNVTNEKMFTHINEQSNRGFIAYSVDEPRQYGIRIKYRFGGLAD